MDGANEHPADPRPSVLPANEERLQTTESINKSLCKYVKKTGMKGAPYLKIKAEPLSPRHSTSNKIASRLKQLPMISVQDRSQPFQVKQEIMSPQRLPPNSHLPVVSVKNKQLPMISVSPPALNVSSKFNCPKKSIKFQTKSSPRTTILSFLIRNNGAPKTELQTSQFDSTAQSEYSPNTSKQTLMTSFLIQQSPTNLSELQVIPEQPPRLIANINEETPGTLPSISSSVVHENNMESVDTKLHETTTQAPETPRRTLNSTQHTQNSPFDSNFVIPETRQISSTNSTPKTPNTTRRRKLKTPDSQLRRRSRRVMRLASHEPSDSEDEAGSCFVEVAPPSPIDESPFAKFERKPLPRGDCPICDEPSSLIWLGICRTCNLKVSFDQTKRLKHYDEIMAAKRAARFVAKTPDELMQEQESSPVSQASEFS